MCKTTIISAIVLLICLAPATSDEGTAKKAVASRLASVEHSFHGLEERLVFGFGDADGKTAAPVPEYEVLHLEFSSRLIITLKNTPVAAPQIEVVSPLVSRVAFRQSGNDAEIIVQTRKGVVCSVNSDKNGTLVVGLSDPAKSRWWLRIDSPDFTSPQAAGRLRSALLRRDIETFPAGCGGAKYFIASTQSWADAKEAEKQKAELSRAVDEIVAADPLLPFVPTVSLRHGLDEAEGEPLQLSPRKAAIEKLVRALEKDPADYKASLKSKLLSPTCRAIIKHGKAALPSLVAGAYAENDNVRRSCIFMLLFDEGLIATTAPAVRVSVAIDALAEKDATLRAEALLRLTYLELAPALLPALVGALDDEDAWVRFFAAQKLALNGVPRGVPGLIDCITADQTCSRAGEVLCEITQKQFNPGGPGSCPADKRPALAKEWMYWWEKTGRFVALPLEPQLYETARKTLDDFVLGDLAENEEKPRTAQLTRRGDFVFGRRSPKLAVLGLFDGLAEGEPSLRCHAEIAVESPHDLPGESALYVFDIDGDGTDEVMAVFGGVSQETVKKEGKVKPARNTTETLTCVIWRVDAKAKKLVEIFRHEIYRKTVRDADGLFPVHEAERLIFAIGENAEGLPLLTATRLRISGDGANARAERTALKLEPEGPVYKMSVIEKPPVKPAPAEEKPQAADETPPQSGDEGVPSETVESQADKVLGKVHKIVVVKSKGVLIAYDKQNNEMKRYTVITGANTGDKEIEGDKKTPEGEFYICVKNTASKYHLSLGLSYPNIEDAERGLKAQLITKQQHDAIVTAIKKGGIPPWKTKLGGEIFIHGAKGERTDTAGCVSMTNADVEELFAQTALGAKVVIKP